MSVIPDEIAQPSAIRKLIAGTCDHMAGHANPRSHKDAVEDTGNAARELSSLYSLSGEEDESRFWDVMSALAGDDTRTERMTDADTLRVLSQAAGDPSKGYAVLRDALPQGYIS